MLKKILCAAGFNNASVEIDDEGLIRQTDGGRDERGGSCVPR